MYRIVVSFAEYITWEVKSNMSYLQFIAPSGFEYRIYNDHIDVSYGKDMWANINGVWGMKAEESEDKMMSKFKVGDIVRVRSADEMDEWLADNIKKLASTNAIIGNVFNDGNGTFYFLAGHEGTYFNDTLLEDHIYSKDDILTLYVNTCYFGEGYYGIYEASKGYYNKEPKDLTLDEATMLAGVPNAPSVYAPTVNPDLAKKRQKHVLNKMVEYGYISQEEANTI